MLRHDQLPALQATLAAVGDDVDGWLLFDFRGTNPIMRAVVGDEVAGTRRAYAWLPRTGVPVAIVHAIDAELWRAWPREWTTCHWTHHEDLARLLAATVGGKRVAMEYAPGGDVPYVDYVPAGTLEFVRRAGAEPVTSAELVTRWCSVWSDADLASHRRAAAHIDAIAHAALAHAGERARTATPATEHELSQWVLAAIARAGLETVSTPTVSWGANAARLHYAATAGDCAPLVPGALLLLDLWAREPGGVFADHTWMASLGAPTARQLDVWTTVRDARDAAIEVVRAARAEGRTVTGADADRAAKAVIGARGFGGHVVGRTGHSIDRFGLHGFGPCLDDTETHDGRRLIPGVGFSVEPGVFVAGEIGVNSEVNVLVRERDLVVTPSEPQRELIVL